MNINISVFNFSVVLFIAGRLPTLKKWGSKPIGTQPVLTSSGR
jgi:hypothetical protein